MAKAPTQAPDRCAEIITVHTTELIKILDVTMMDPSLVPCIFGSTGIGKSQISYQAALRYAGIKYDPYAPVNNSVMTDTRLGQKQEEDLMGIPKCEMRIFKKGDSKFKVGQQMIEDIYWKEFYRCLYRGKEVPEADGMTVNRLPDFFPRKDQGKHVWFFDELNRARKAMVQCLFQLFLDRRYSNYEVPEDVRIIAAGNWSPQSAQQYNCEKLDPAFKARLIMIYYLGPLYEEWKLWAQRAGIHDAIISFLGTHPNLLVTEAPEDQVSPNPRTWEKSSNLIKITDDKDVRRAGLAGLLGLKATSLLIDYLRDSYEPLPHPADLRKALDFARKCINKKQNDKITSLITSIGDFIGNGGDCSSKDLKTFIKEIPKELAFTLMQRLGTTQHGMEMLDEVTGTVEAGYDEEILAIFQAATETEKTDLFNQRAA